MPIRLRDGEKIEAEAHFHWSAFLLSKILAGLSILILIITILNLIINRFNNVNKNYSLELFFIFILFMPFVYKWLQNKSKKYIVTNQRVYIENGIIAKSETELPLNKINDILLKQGIVQRLVGAGNIRIFTGNDKPTIIFDIDAPDSFKNKLTEMIENKSRN